MSLQPIEGLTPREQRKLEKMMMRELLQQEKNTTKQAKKKKLKQKPMQTQGIEKPPTKRIKLQRQKSKVSSSNQLNSEISEKPKPENQSSVNKDNNDGEIINMQKESIKIEENAEYKKSQIKLKIPQSNQHQAVTFKALSPQENQQKAKQSSVKVDQKNKHQHQESIEREKPEVNQIMEKEKSIKTKISVGYIKPLNKAYNITETQFFEYIMNYSYSTRERIIENADNLAKDIDLIQKIEGMHLPQAKDPEMDQIYSKLPSVRNIVNEGENIDFSDKRFVEMVHKYFNKDRLAP